MSLLVSLLVGFVLSLLIGFFAYWRGSLTRSGVLGAILTGTAIFGFGGFIPGLLLVAFFVSSTLLSKYKARAKESVNEKFQKGSQRDLGQALANGGWGAVLAIAHYAWFETDAAGLLFAAFVGAMATVTADTWATEIGVLSKSLPRMITTGRIVPAGTSGGVTLFGALAAFCGALFIGVIAAFDIVFFPYVENAWNSAPLPDSGTFLPLTFSYVSRLLIIVSVSGLVGSLFDSFLGATVQAIYFSEYDERQTEKQFDSQGNPTRLIRGWRWLNNDWVNFFASVFGSGVATALAFFIL